MKQLKLFLLLTVLKCISAHVIPDGVDKEVKLHPDAGLNVVEMIKRNGYSVEVHEVKTPDGYILTMQRIPHGKNGASSTPDENRPRALVVHGLLSSAADWMAMGPGISLGYILADLGYDVWLGNARGNTWSRKHEILDPDVDKEKFWDFSWHEIGYYDLPTKIDYILELTKQEKLFYFGHSQGCTDFMVMASTRPEYNEKIRLASLLAPPIFMKNMDNPFLQLVSKFERVANWLNHYVGIHELLPHSDLLSLLGQKACDEEAVFNEICSNIVFLIAGYNSQQLNKTMIPVFITNLPAGAATKQALHYGQGIQSGKFRQYDHGIIKNLIKYGKLRPPDYDLSKVTAPVALYYSSKDNMVAIEDVDKLATLLPNVANKYLIKYELFTHLDFLIAKDVVSLLYEEILETMKKY